MRHTLTRFLTASSAATVLAAGWMIPAATAAPPVPVAVPTVAAPAAVPEPALRFEYEHEFGGESIFPQTGSGSDWLREPAGIAIDPLNPNHVFVAAGNKVVRWDKSNGFVDSFNPTGLARAIDVALVPMTATTTRVIITDTDDAANPIKYTESRTAAFVPLPEIVGTGGGMNQFDRPFGIAATPDRELYIADTDNSRIQMINAYDGESIRGWGGWDYSSYLPITPLPMDPMGVAVGLDGSVYVTRAAHHGLAKYSATGVFLTAWGGYEDGPGRLISPWGVDVGPDGNVYVVDFSMAQVSVYTPAGKHLTSFGSYGKTTPTIPAGPGKFNNPKGVAIGADGRVYVADSTNFRVQIFRQALTGTAGVATGTVRVGSPLTATGEKWSVTPSAVTYQWLRGTSIIPGATAKAYTPTLADVGYRLAVRVKAHKDALPGRPAYADVAVTSTPSAVVPKVAATLTLTSSRSTQVYGSTSRAALTARVAVVSGGSAAGTVQFRDGATVVGTAPVVGTSATFTLARTTAIGRRSLTAAFVPASAQVAATTSSAAAVRVTKAPAKITVKAVKSKVTTKAKAKVSITVKVVGVTKPIGKVKVTWAKGKKKVSKTYTLKPGHRGKFTATLPRLAKGTYRVSATYAGSALTLKKTSTAKKLTVK